LFEGSDAETLEAFLAEVADPAIFLLPSPEHAASATRALQSLYAVAARAVPAEAGADAAVLSSTPLPQLHVAGFDVEQVWHQVEGQTEALLRRARRLIARVPDDVSLLAPDMEAAVDDLIAGVVRVGGESDSDSDASEGGEGGPSKRVAGEVDFDALAGAPLAALRGV